jgi:general secretion pathway protein A
MTPAYVDHFGFKTAPFSKEIPGAELWLPPSKVALIDELCDALREKSSVVLVGLGGHPKPAIGGHFKTGQ